MGMIRILGGAMRTGKGILARRLLRELQMPYLSLDVLKMGLFNGVPAFGMDPEAPGPVVAEKLWPLMRAMCVNMIETEVYYLIEGEILPRHAAELAQAYPGLVCACFLGYTEATPAQKLREIRAFSGYPNDWMADLSDAEALGAIQEGIEFSRYLRAECARYGFPYFDTSTAFLETLDRAAAYLRGE
jgi:putative acetyltransferase